MKFYIYETTNNINNKKYIGQSSKSINENYLGSGFLLKKAIKKYGKENFSKTILCYADNKNEADELEKYHIEKNDAVNSENYYNIASGGQGGNLGPEVNKLISEKISGKNNGMYGKEHTIESRNKMSISHKGTLKGPHSEETKKILSEKAKKQFEDPAARKLISEKAKERLSNYTEEEKALINEKRSSTLKKTWDNNEELKKSHSKRFSGKNNPMYGVEAPNKGKHWYCHKSKKCKMLHNDDPIIKTENWKKGRKYQ